MWEFLVSHHFAMIEAEQRRLRSMSPAERDEYMRQKEEARRKQEERDRAEKEADATYRNPESDFYDPLRVLLERNETKEKYERIIASGSASKSSA